MAKEPIKGVIKKLRVRVTQEDIDEAIRAKSSKCMIQRAFERDHPQYKNVLVDKNQIRFNDKKLNVIYTCDQPVRGRVMLLKWDSAETVKPWDMWLRYFTIRERILRQGRNSPKTSEDSFEKHSGVVPRAKTKKARQQLGRDRVFGAKLWTEELAKVRADLGVVAPSSK